MCDMEAHFGSNPGKHIHLMVGLLDKMANLEAESEEAEGGSRMKHETSHLHWHRGCWLLQEPLIFGRLKQAQGLILHPPCVALRRQGEPSCL